MGQKNFYLNYLFFQHSNTPSQSDFFLYPILEPELQDTGVVVAFQGIIRIGKYIVIHDDVIGHQPDLAGQVPVDAKGDVFFGAAPDRSVGQVQYAVTDRQFQFAIF